jgi:hypothetical protein
MLHAGSLVLNVAHHFGRSRQTIHNLANRYANTGSVNDRQRPGRERATSRRDDRTITLAHLRDHRNCTTSWDFCKDHPTPFKAVKLSSPCQETLHWADFNGTSQGRQVGMVNASSALEAEPVE